MASASADVTTLNHNQPPRIPSFVEMRDFAVPVVVAPATPTASTSTNLHSQQTPAATAAADSSTSIPVTTASGTQNQPMQSSASTLGPAIEGSPTIAASSSTSNALVLSITLMTNTGARHPYRIDEKYLSARSAAARTAAGTFDPRELKGYSLKELIWTDWREEWEPRPASPDRIRLIIMGKLVDDKKALKEYPFSFDLPNVVQISVKPSDFDEENEAAHAKSNKSIRVRDGDDEGGAGCRCVIL